MGASDAEVAELAGVAERDFSGLVDAVVADAEPASVADGCSCGSCSHSGAERGIGRLSLSCSVRANLVVVSPERVEPGLEVGEGTGGRGRGEMFLEGLVEAFDAPMFVKRRE